VWRSLIVVQMSAVGSDWREIPGGPEKFVAFTAILIWASYQTPGRQGRLLPPNDGT